MSLKIVELCATKGTTDSEIRGFTESCTLLRRWPTGAPHAPSRQWWSHLRWRNTRAAPRTAASSLCCCQTPLCGPACWIPTLSQKCHILTCKASTKYHTTRCSYSPVNVVFSFCLLTRSSPMQTNIGPQGAPLQHSMYVSIHIGWHRGCNSHNLCRLWGLINHWSRILVMSSQCIKSESSSIITIEKHYIAPAKNIQWPIQQIAPVCVWIKLERKPLSSTATCHLCNTVVAGWRKTTMIASCTQLQNCTIKENLRLYILGGDLDFVLNTIEE